MAVMHYFSSFVYIFIALIATTSARSDNVAPPTSAPLLAPQGASTGVNCMDLVYDMADCISFLSVGSTDKKPDPQCCNGLMTVLKTDVECVCEALKSTAQFGINIDMERAAALPSACNTKAPSLDSCHISSAPSPSSNPSAAPVSSAPSSNHVEPPANSPAMATIGAAPVSPKSQAPSKSASSNSPAPLPQVSTLSPAPVPQASTLSPAPVPQASTLSPAPVPYFSPLSPADISPSQAPTGVNYYAPAPSPTSGHHFAMVKKYDVYFSMVVASIFYLLA